MRVQLLADVPGLIEAVGELRWREWGRPPEPTDPAWWIDCTRRESGRVLPATWVATGSGGSGGSGGPGGPGGSGDVLGAVGLGAYDIEERRDRSPWVLGMVVRPEARRTGTGRLLLSHLTTHAAGLGHSEVWVATEAAVAFYEACGWHPTETLPRPTGETTILRREVGK